MFAFQSKRNLNVFFSMNLKAKNVCPSKIFEKTNRLVQSRFHAFSAGMAEWLRQAAADRCMGVQIPLPAPKPIWLTLTNIKRVDYLG